MAINGWDGNGKTDDLYDDMVEYKLYQENLERVKKNRILTTTETVTAEFLLSVRL